MIGQSSMGGKQPVIFPSKSPFHAKALKNQRRKDFITPLLSTYYLILTTYGRSFGPKYRAAAVSR